MDKHYLMPQYGCEWHKPHLSLEKYFITFIKHNVPIDSKYLVPNKAYDICRHWAAEAHLENVCNTIQQNYASYSRIAAHSVTAIHSLRCQIIMIKSHSLHLWFSPLPYNFTFSPHWEFKHSAHGGLRMINNEHAFSVAAAGTPACVYVYALVCERAPLSALLRCDWLRCVRGAWLSCCAPEPFLESRPRARHHFLLPTILRYPAWPPGRAHKHRSVQQLWRLHSDTHTAQSRGEHLAARTAKTTTDARQGYTHALSLSHAPTYTHTHIAVTCFAAVLCFVLCSSIPALCPQWPFHLNLLTKFHTDLQRVHMRYKMTLNLFSDISLSPIHLIRL